MWFFKKHKCYLCSRDFFPQESRFVCADCKKIYAELRFFGCARCSQSECIDCKNLSSFQSVETLYLYKDPLVTFTHLVKKDQHHTAIQIFMDIFKREVTQNLKRLLEHHQITHIFLMPHRKERFFRNSWHINHMLHEILLNLKNEKEFQLFYPFLKKRTKKQSAVATEKRSSNPIADAKNIAFERHPKLCNENANILIVDDILTSGKNALWYQQALEQNFPNARWYMWTLMRTPIKKTRPQSKL